MRPFIPVPEVGNNILIGSEDPPCDSHIFVDPDNYDLNFSNQWTVQAQRLGLRFPDLGIPGKLKGCVDLYDVTEDWMPIYDSSCIEGYFMACGTSGNQFKNAPVVGKVMAELIEYCESGNDHDGGQWVINLKTLIMRLASQLFRVSVKSIKTVHFLYWAKKIFVE